MGLILHQKPGSIGPAMLVVLGLCCLSWGVRWMYGGGADPSAERLFYQATMPGLDEELFFRGLLFALFLRAFITDTPASTAAFWPAAAIVTFLFAAGHAFAFHKGGLAFDAGFLAFTAALGFGFLWIRQRTGSLLLPILAHNVINFGGSFLS
jgi:uncharacterized protein